MNEHHFSNQKSALEEYFESLLTEDTDTSGESSALLEAASKDNQPDETAETVIQITEKIVIHDDAVITSDSVTISDKTINERRSVADMLASIEQLATEEPEQATDFAEPAAKIILPMPTLAPAVETAAEVIVETEIAKAEQVEVEVKENVSTDTEMLEATSLPAVTETCSTPDWAESRFQCLLFKVGGLSLAVPLIKLNGVIPWSDRVVETPNQTEWYLGVLVNHDKKVQVIDTAVMVLPEEHRKNMAAEPADRLSHILLVDDQRWGLACDSIGEVIWLKKDDVKWRSNKTKRPWLLGTAIDQMCAVMDTEAFAEMLNFRK